jgi:O-antigen ligase
LPLPRRLILAGPAVAAVGLAILWPLSAYAFNPVLLPAMIVVAGAGVLILWRPEYGIALALALSPLLDAHLSVPAGANIALPQKPFEFLLPATLGAVLIYGILIARDERRDNRPRLAAAVPLFIGAGLLSSLFALDPSQTVTKVFLLVTALTVFLGVFQICRDRDQLTVIVAGVVVAVLIAGLQGILQQLNGQYSTEGFIVNGQFVGRVQGSFGHPNQYGGFLAVLMPVAAAVCLARGFPRRLRWLAGFAVLAAIPALNYSYARGAIGGLIIGSLIWLLVFKPKAALFVVSSVVIVALVVAPVKLKDRFSTQDQAGSVGIRADIWGAALDIYSERPLLGVGPDNFPVAYRGLPSTLANASQRQLLHNELLLIPPYAQNLYLNVLAEEGLVGIVALALLLAYGVSTAYRGCKLSDPRARTLGFGLGVAMMTLIIHSFVEVTLTTALMLPLFGLLATMTVWLWVEREEPVRVARRAPAGLEPSRP